MPNNCPHKNNSNMTMAELGGEAAGGSKHTTFVSPYTFETSLS